MRGKFKTFLCKLCSSAVLAGAIMFFIGAHYSIVKAGIPYQDPTVEMQIKYAINNGIGKILIEVGFMLALCSGVLRLLFWLLFKKFAKKNKVEANIENLH